MLVPFRFRGGAGGLAPVLVLSLAAFTISGCKKEEAPRQAATPAPQAVSEAAQLGPLPASRGPLPPAEFSGSAHVTYRENAHVLETPEAKQALKGMSSDGVAFLLDAANPKCRSLKAGDTLVLKGYTARKIFGAEIQGNNVLVITEPATLMDVVEDGQINMSAPVRFHPMQAKSLVPSLEEKILQAFAPPPVLADNGAAPVLAAVQGMDVKGWKTDFSATPAQGQTNIKLKMTRQLSGLRAVISGDGYLSDLDFESNIELSKHSYQNISAGFKNINGAINFNWEAGTDTPGAHTGDDRIKLPAAIGIPLYEVLDGIPLYLEIGSALIIKPAFSGGKEFSRGAFRITYDGVQHFTAKKGNMDTNGNVTGDIQFMEGQNVSFAPMGMVVAFAAPRVELTLGFSNVLKMDDLATAASYVDKAADFLEKKLLSPDVYQALKNTPAGQMSFSQAVDNALKSDAAAYFEMVSSVGMSNSGISAISPCTRHDLHLWGKVGVSAEAFGQDMGKAETDVYRKDVKRIDPPGTKLCEQVGGG